MHSHPNARMTRAGLFRLSTKTFSTTALWHSWPQKQGSVFTAPTSWLATPFSTLPMALNRLGLGRLRHLDPKPRRSATSARCQQT